MTKRRCRECGRVLPDEEFREERGGSVLRLAYCRECKRREDVLHNRQQNERKRKGLIR